MTEQKHKGRGGRRPGAGRPAVPGKKLTVAFRVSPETKALLGEAKIKGLFTSADLDGLLRETCLKRLKGDL